jgi:hypothetical protein
MRNVISIVAILLIAAVTAGLLVFFSLEGRPQELSAAESAVVINEAMSGNKGACLDDKGKSSDWVELYNPTDEAVSLGRFSLSDNEEKLDRWKFPDVTINPHSYMVVYLSGKSQKDSGSLHASFKLNAKGDQLILSAAGNIVDSIKLPELPDNVSYGRVHDQWQISDSPTPGKANALSAG